MADRFAAKHLKSDRFERAADGPRIVDRPQELAVDGEVVVAVIADDEATRLWARDRCDAAQFQRGDHDTAHKSISRMAGLRA